MKSSSNGDPVPFDSSGRRFHLDERSGAARAGHPESHHSGRRFVIVAAIALLVLWGVLYVFFLGWRDRYHQRAAFGAREVVPTVEPLAEITPPDVDPSSWRQAVAETRSMLAALTASGVLDIPQMERLRDELAARVARAQARPDTALDELRALWDDMEARARPILARRHPRPELLRDPESP